MAKEIVWANSKKCLIYLIGLRILTKHTDNHNQKNKQYNISKGADITDSLRGTGLDFLI